MIRSPSGSWRAAFGIGAGGRATATEFGGGVADFITLAIGSALRGSTALGAALPSTDLESSRRGSSDLVSGCAVASSGRGLGKGLVSGAASGTVTLEPNMGDG